jgi:hypothetical protein
VHPEKAPSPKDSIPLPNVIDVRVTQPDIAEAPIDVTLSGIVKEDGTTPRYPVRTLFVIINT